MFCLRGYFSFPFFYKLFSLKISYWGALNLTEKQTEYAASDVLYLHKIKDRLNKMLERENKIDIFNKVIEFLPIRVELDLAGFDLDIFSH